MTHVLAMLVHISANWEKNHNSKKVQVMEGLLSIVFFFHLFIYFLGGVIFQVHILKFSTPLQV